MITYEEKQGQKLFKGLTLEQLSKIKEDLTFDNPQYQSAIRYSKWGSVRIPSKLRYYKVISNDILVPLGYEAHPFAVFVKSDAKDDGVEYPPFQLELRDIQKKAVSTFKGLGTLVLPTGTGKSICGLYLAGKLGKKTLIVVNKDDLVDGWIQDAKLAYNDALDIGLVKGKVFKIGEHITLTTIQTLSRLGADKLKELHKEISMLIVDEVHRAGAVSYQVLNEFPAYLRLGLTATKMRNDGLVDVIDLLCGRTLFDGTMCETDAIIPAENIHVISRKSNIFWRPKKAYYSVRTKRTIEDYVCNHKTYKRGTIEWVLKMEELVSEGLVKPYPLRLHDAYDKIATDEEFNNLVCEDIKNAYMQNKSCIVFCKTIEQLELLYNKLIPTCPKIQKFYGNMSDSKADIKARAESKEVLVTLATLSIACEGTNVKAWEYGFLVADIANDKDLIQALGRLRRTVEGKTDVYIFDYQHPLMVAIKNHWSKRVECYKSLGIPIDNF